MTPTWLPRRPPEGSKKQIAPVLVAKTAQEAPKSLPRDAKRLPRGTQEALKTAQEAPKRRPRDAQERPKAAQEAFKRGPRGSKLR